MYYGDKREAKVNIMAELVNRGWEVYGYTPDESDSMTDYYSPAHWDGIATKNGYVLVIDNSGTYYSGYEVKSYNYNKSAYAASDRIKKLTAMMNDSASTENEKASCATLIEKEEEKAGVKPTYTVKETYPTFQHGNPKSCTWHIEREGQIVAKGKGVFAVNDYDWEDHTKTAAEQKAEKMEAFINKIEKVLINSDALKAEVIIIEKKVIKPVAKEDKTINVGDLLSFSYHGHFWIVTNIYTVGEQVRISYELAGSEKRGYNRVNNTKRYYQPLARLEKEMKEGKTEVHTLQEVTEYEEKTVFVKTKRNQTKQTIVDAPAIETTEEAKTQETETVTETNTYNTDQTNNHAELNINNDKKGVEIKFVFKPSINVIEGLKEMGFRWSSYASVWWAKQSEERLKFARMFVETFNTITQEETETIDSETVIEAQEVQSENVIFHNFNTNNENEQEEWETMTNSFDDLLSKFEDIEITAESKVSADDSEFCKEQEEIYIQTITAYNSLQTQLQAIKPLIDSHGRKYGETNANGTFYAKGNAFDAGFSKYDLEKNTTKIKDRFISNICHYFMKKYNVTVDYQKIQNKYDLSITYEQIIDQIYIELNGYNFTEKAEQEIKTSVKDIFRHGDKINIKNSKLILDGYFAHHDSIWKEYRLGSKHEAVFKALQHFEDGSTAGNAELIGKYCGYNNERNQSNYERYEPTTMNSVKSIKFLKNGKLEIEFTTNQQAAKFAQDYCGYSQKTA